MHHPCVGTYNFFVSQRLAVILSENQIQRYCSCMISRLFRNSTVSIAKSGPKVENLPFAQFQSSGQLPPADVIYLRCNHSTRHLKCEPRRREAMKFALAKKIRDFCCPHPSPASIFSKNPSFRNVAVMHHPCVGNI